MTMEAFVAAARRGGTWRSRIGKHLASKQVMHPLQLQSITMVMRAVSGKVSKDNISIPYFILLNVVFCACTTSSSLLANIIKAMFYAVL